jgi:diaminopimelate epimerase
MIMTDTPDSTHVSFAKMQGTGNDFIVVDNRSHGFSTSELSDCASSWCRRRFGIGADGLLALDVPESAAADYRMHYVNADGSRATMCGNGARCLFRFARQAGFEKPELAFDTDAGLYRATHPGGDASRVRLFVPDAPSVESSVELDQDVPGSIRALYFTNAGTEHLVALVDDVETVPVREWGRRLRGDPSLAPAGANVNFVEDRGGDEIVLRTYEKGVEDETLSCGTGVLAAAVVVERAREREPTDPMDVQTRGGRLRVGAASTDRGTERYLDGPAVLVFRGTIEWSPSTPRPNLDEAVTAGAQTDCP